MLHVCLLMIPVTMFYRRNQHAKHQMLENLNYLRVLNAIYVLKMTERLPQHVTSAKNICVVNIKLLLTFEKIVKNEQM